MWKRPEGGKSQGVGRLQQRTPCCGGEVRTRRYGYRYLGRRESTGGPSCTLPAAHTTNERVARARRELGAAYVT